MSTLTELVDIAQETKENSKNALIEKGLELDDSFKLSDVDEKIAEIQAGGGGEEFECTFNKVSIYTNVDDVKPASDLNYNQTVKSYFNTWFGVPPHFKKIVFDLSVKNVGNSTPYTGEFTSENVVPFKRYASISDVTVSGSIENGTGDIQVTLTTNNGNNFGFGYYTAEYFVTFLFGDLTLDKTPCNPVIYTIYVNNN